MKSAIVNSSEKTAEITIDAIGRWNSVNSDDYNFLVSLDGKLESAITRAMDSDDGIGMSRDKSVSVTINK